MSLRLTDSQIWPVSAIQWLGRTASEARDKQSHASSCVPLFTRVWSRPDSRTPTAASSLGMKHGQCCQKASIPGWRYQNQNFRRFRLNPDPNYNSLPPSQGINGPRQWYHLWEHSSTSRWTQPAMESYTVTATSDVGRLAHPGERCFGPSINSTLHQSGIVSLPSGDKKYSSVF